MRDVFCACAGSVLLVVCLSPACWAAGLEENAGSLLDVILPRDQRRLEQVLLGAEPYNSLETAYHIALGATALGGTTSTKEVGRV